MKQVYICVQLKCEENGQIKSVKEYERQIKRGWSEKEKAETLNAVRLQIRCNLPQWDTSSHSISVFSFEQIERGLKLGDRGVNENKVPHLLNLTMCHTLWGNKKIRIWFGWKIRLVRDVYTVHSIRSLSI